MSSNSLRWLVLCCLGLAPLAPFARDITCPQTIVTSESALIETPGWEAIGSQQQHPIENAEIYDGHPSELASLVPDTSEDQGSVHLAIWNLAIDRERDTWIGCHYRGSTIMLARKIKGSATRCIFTYEPKGPTTPGKLIGMACG